MYANNNNNNPETTTTSEALRRRVRSVRWLVLDSLALSSGMTVYSDWDLMGNNDKAVNWDVLENAPLPNDAAAQQVVAADGAGWLDLVLDVLLFWPTSTTDANTNGLSVEGLARMNHKRQGASWDELYLRQLQYVVLRNALGIPNQPGLLGNDDRAMLVAVLAASGNSMHGRLAVSYLHQIVGPQNLVRSENNKWSKNAATSVCSMSLAVSLLILLIGDAAAAPVLEEHQKSCADLWESLLGPRLTSDTTLFRSPLPIDFASKGVQFLLDHFRPDIHNDRNGLRLFLDLVVVLQDPARHGVNWGIQLIHKLYCELRDDASATENDEWVQAFHERCLRTAIAVLKSVPRASDLGEIGGGGDEHVDVPDGVPQPFGHRRDLTLLLRQSRLQQSHRRLQTSGAVRARQVAYELVAQLANESNVEDDTGNKLSFELPIVLFQCAAAEGEKMQAHLTRAMDALLVIYQKLARDQKAASDVMKEHHVAALLPSLVSAACADSAGARLEVVRWASSFLASMDTTAALHICCYLAEDYDPFVSGLAKKAVPKLRKVLSGSNVPMQYQHTVSFLNRDDPLDSQALRVDLEQKINLVSQTGMLSRSTACMLLHDFDFAVESAMRSLQQDRPKTLLESGLLLRCDAMESDEKCEKAGLAPCGICYDDSPTVFGMACGHTFCRDCWHSFLQESISLSSGPAILRTRCPQHDCSERITPDEIQLLSPELMSTWNEAYLSLFIDKYTQYRHCTGPDCHMIAHIVSQLSLRCLPVTCSSCDTSFCFHCAEGPHQPARCDDHKEWQRIFGSSSFYIRKNSKPCPSCHVPIEKNQGCNHVTCTYYRFLGLHSLCYTRSTSNNISGSLIDCRYPVSCRVLLAMPLVSRGTLSGAHL